VALPGAIAYPAVFILGCAAGSFINVCIYRLPHDRSVVTPPSHCPQCGARLGAWELAPLVSFLALGRKCRHCGTPISWRYFLVELITGLVFVAAWETCGLQGRVIASWGFAAAMVGVLFTDLDHMIIPDKLVVAALLAAVLNGPLSASAGHPELVTLRSWSLALSPALGATLAGLAVFALARDAVRPCPGRSPDKLAYLKLGGAVAAAAAVGFALPWAAVGGALGAFVFVLIRALSQLLFRREGMGLGDVKLAGAMGAMLGPGGALLSFGLAILTGAAVGVLLILLRLRRRMEYLPFGPFLAASALVALLVPHGLANAANAVYLRWLAAIGLSTAF